MDRNFSIRPLTEATASAAAGCESSIFSNGPAAR